MTDKDKPTAEAAADETKAIDDAANEAQDKPKRSPGEAAAEKRELGRQQDVIDAVAEANENELPKLGGPLREPGLGR